MLRTPGRQGGIISMKARTIRKIVAWTLCGVTLLFLLSGFGITSSEIVTPLTIGVMGKSFAYRLHTLLWGPFLVLLLLHIYLGMGRRRDQ
jgi:hypothetical protein